MSYLFVGSTVVFGLYSYFMHKPKEIEVIKPIIPKKQINADVININLQTILSFYDENNNCIGCKIMDSHDNVTMKTGIIDYKYNHTMMCRITFLDNDKEFASMLYDTESGDIKQFNMDDIENGHTICGIIINCLYLSPQCKQLSMIDGNTEMNMYIKKHGTTKSYGHGIAYDILYI